MAFDTSYNVIYWNLYILGGQPLLSRHYSILRGCPLNTGFTVPCIFHHMGRENQEGKEPCFSDTFNTFWRHRQHDWPGQAVWIGTGSLWLEDARSRLLCSRPMMMTAFPEGVRLIQVSLYPRQPEVMMGHDREWWAYRQVCGQRGRNLTMSMAVLPIKCFPRQLLE